MLDGSGAVVADGPGVGGALGESEESGADGALGCGGAALVVAEEGVDGLGAGRGSGSEPVCAGVGFAAGLVAAALPVGFVSADPRSVGQRTITATTRAATAATITAIVHVLPSSGGGGAWSGVRLGAGGDGRASAFSPSTGPSFDGLEGESSRRIGGGSPFAPMASRASRY